jgi:hypothetical protein
MVVKVKLYADKEGKQYKISIPKKIVELQGYKHKDEFEVDGKNIILKKVE